MRIILNTLILTYLISSTFACDHLSYDNYSDLTNFMGKNSKFYDAYKQGKCVLDRELKDLSIEQRKILASLISKSYIIDK